MRARLVLALGIFAATAAIAQESGEDLFADRCAMCHAPTGKGQGPSLTGVIGRKAGSTLGFPYTSAIKNSGVIWTPSNLVQFLANPAAMIPGTAMPIRVNDPDQRTAIVHYLAVAK